MKILELKNNDPRVILPGAIVSVYDPISERTKKAKILSRYGIQYICNFNVVCDDYGNKYGEEELWRYPDLVDVQFLDNNKISKGHFTEGVY